MAETSLRPKDEQLNQQSHDAWSDASTCVCRLSSGFGIMTGPFHECSDPQFSMTTRPFMSCASIIEQRLMGSNRKIPIDVLDR